MESVCANSCDWGRGDCGHEINNASNMCVCVCVRITRVYRMDIIYYSLVDVYYTLLFYSFLFFSFLCYSILFYIQAWPHDIKIGVLWLLVNVFHFTVYCFIINEIRKIDNDFELN